MKRQRVRSGSDFRRPAHRTGCWERLCLWRGRNRLYPVRGFVTEDYLKDRLRELALQIPEPCFLNLKEQLDVFCEDGKGDCSGIQKNSFDGAIGAYLVNPLKNEYTYDEIAKDFLGTLYPSREELLGKKTLADAWEQDRQEMVRCICYQAYTARKAKDAIREQLEKTGMKELFDQVEMPLVFALHDMEREGVLVKAGELKNLRGAATGENSAAGAGDLPSGWGGVQY